MTNARSSLRRSLLLGFWLLMVASQTASGLAQTPSVAPSGVPDESAVVHELDVIGRRPGPALWRVTRGDSEVVIIGALSPLPHLLQWDQTRVQHALQDSTVLYLEPNRARVGLLDAAGMFLGQGALRPAHGADMESTLPPDLRARFVSVRDRLHLDPKRYQHWKPAVAGLLILGDFHRGAGLSDDKPGTTIAKLARANHTEIRTVGEFKAKPLFDAAARLTDAQNQACLTSALDDVEHEETNARDAAAAWAVGDLKTVRERTAGSLLDRCLLQMPSVQTVVSQGIREAVQTIQAALNRPGRSVAVIDLTFLLRRNGVLDRLKAQGDQISIPAD